MGKFKRSIVVITLITFLTATMPFQVLASDISTKSEKTENSQSKIKEEITEAEKAAVKVVKEVEEKRESNIKHYLLEDKTYEAVIYNYPVHYFEDGKWKDIDNSLSETIDNRTLDEGLTNEQEVKEGSKVEEKKTSEDESKKESSSEIKAPEVENKEIPMSEVKTSEGENKEVPKAEDKVTPKEKEKPDTKAEETKNKPLSQDNVQASGQQNNPDSQVEKNNDKKSSNNSILDFGKSNGKEGEKVFENKSNSFKFKLAKKGDSKKLVTISKDKYEISWSLQDAAKVTGKLSEYNEDKINKEIEEKANGIVNNSKNASLKSKSEKNLEKQNIVESEKKKILPNITSGVNFRNILKDVDLNYQLISDRVKENLIINKNIKDTTFTYNMEVKNLIAVKQEDNSVIFYDKDDRAKEVFLIKAPFMFDSKGVESTDIQVNVEETKKGYSLTLIPSKEWLNHKDRAYPVTIDPDVTTELGRDKITDTFITSVADPDVKYNNQYLRVGKHNTIGTTKSFIKFSLPNITSADMVVAAQLDLFLNEAPMTNEINVHKVTSDWNADATHNLIWSNQPSVDSNVADYNIVSGSSKWVSWDVTEIAKSWYTTGNNYGLMLKSANESVANSSFWSSDMHDEYTGARPKVQIKYVNNSGLEDYWTYHSQDVGRAGTGYVNDYNGNLVFTHNDIALSGSKLPINLSHVYNSNFKGYIDPRYPLYSYGDGWRLNLSQRLKETVINNKTYYEYTDGDGTKIYLQLDSSQQFYKDELGLGYKMTINSQTPSDDYFVLEDKKNNKMTFTRGGYLFQVIDNSGNIMTLTYDFAPLIKVTDGAGRETILSVDSKGYLTGITDPSGRKTAYTYTGNLLTKITYADGKFVSYAYDSNNNLTEVTDIDGYKIKYTYSTGDVKRVIKVQEYYNDGILGQEMDLSYGFNATTFKDSQNRKNIFQFNNQGNTVSVRDTYNSASYYDYGSSSNKNKMLLNSKMQKSILNYVTNHNLEQDTSNWEPVHWDGSTGTAGYDSSNSYMGNKSFKVKKTNDKSISFMQQQLKLPVGKTYTLSGYIKTESISSSKEGGAAIFLTYQDGTGAWQKVTTNKVVGDSDWTRYETTFEIPANASSGDVYLKAGIIEGTGTAYFDAFQIEEGAIANRYNLVENPNFVLNGSSSFQFWGAENVDLSDGLICIPKTDTTYPSNLDYERYVYNLNGSANINKNIHQYIKVKGKKGDVLVAAGWAKGKSVPIEGLRYFALDVGIRRTDGSMQYTVIPFNQDSAEWQYTSGKAIADSDFTEVILYGLYYKNANAVQFDGFQLYKEEFGQSYQYDSNGNIVSTKDLSEKSSQFQYNTKNDLINSIDPKGNNFKNEYDTKHNLTKATTAENVIYSFSYDSNGNPLTAEVCDASGINKIKSTSVYDAKGNYIKSLTDSSGNTVNFNYDELKGTLKTTTDSKGKTTSYDYDPNTDVLKTVTKSVDGTNISNSYTYENDRIKTINHNGFNYTFGYDKMGNNSTVSVGSQKLITNTYENKSRNLLQSEYGNNQKAAFRYDDLDRITGKRYDADAADRFTYSYDASGNLGYKYDNTNKIGYRYIYDVSNRLVKVNENNGNVINYSYDLNSNLSRLIEKINGTNYSTSYTYDKDNKLKSIAYDSVGITKALNDKLVAKYTFDNSDVTDSSGKGYDGKINGTPTFVSTTRGKGIKLNGVDQWIELPDFGTSSSFSISMFVKPEVLSNSCFLGKANQAGDLNQLWFGIWDNAYAVQVKSSEYWAGQVISSEQPQHVVATLNKINDTSTEVKLYKDSNLIWTTTLNSVFENTCGKGWAIGQDWDYGSISDLFKGEIDEVSIYNSALTQEEINSINSDTVTINRNYDGLGRLDTTTLSNKPTQTDFTTKYSYENGKDTNTTTNRISSIDNYKSASEANGKSLIKYTYDTNGNIETMTQDGNKITYYYNELNELIRENNPVIGKTIVYTYDVGGNITSRAEYPYTTANPITVAATKNIPYSYVDANWKDKLTSYNGKAITYDGIGNPLTYDGYTYSWEMGRQLKSINKTGQAISYKYNDSGIRTEKMVNGVTTKYHLVGDKVTFESNDTDNVYYTYDPAGKLISMNLNGNEYFYVRNAQGDIIGLIDKAGTQVVSYTYDSWGKLISIKDAVGADITNNTTHVGYKNPYRYKGYRYDTETGLYYLQSRYYNPEWGRFINADALGGQVGELLSHNIFAYCNGNPINNFDLNGFRTTPIIGDEFSDYYGFEAFKSKASVAMIECRETAKQIDKVIIATAALVVGKILIEDKIRVKTAKASSNYKAPKGGGGITSKMKLNNTNITFGHGGRHIEGLDMSKVNRAIAEDVVKQGLKKGQYYKGTIVLDNQAITYSSFGVDENLINIGTYFIKKQF